MGRGFFITGTDTGVGKTWATLSLIEYFKYQNKTVIGMKPVASGCYYQNGRLVNDDALQIQAHSSVKASYDLINPYSFEEPVSPHLAGKNNPVSSEKVVAYFKQLQELADFIIVEGAGGWLTPVNETQSISDLACLLGLPVILVVAIKLGCINHAKLTEHAIQAADIDYQGWIAMCLDPDVLYPSEIIQTLSNTMSVPLFGVIPYRKSADYHLFAQQLKI